MQDFIPDSLYLYPGRSLSEFLDPYAWHLRPGPAAPPPFLDVAPKEMIIQPLTMSGFTSQNIFWFILAAIAILTMVRYYHARRLKLLGMAIYNRSAAQQLIRESPVYSHQSFLPLLAIYIITITLMIQQTAENTSPGAANDLKSLLGFIELLGIYIGFSLVKILTIWIIGIIFKNVETAHEYIQNILIYNIVLGILLLPVLIMVVYTYHILMLYLAVLVAIVMISMRFIRGLLIGLSDPKFSLFHLFLYLCTLEILPLAFAAKFLSKYFFS